VPGDQTESGGFRLPNETDLANYADAIGPGLKEGVRLAYESSALQSRTASQ